MLRLRFLTLTLTFTILFLDVAIIGKSMVNPTKDEWPSIESIELEAGKNVFFFLWEYITSSIESKLIYPLAPTTGAFQLSTFNLY